MNGGDVANVRYPCQNQYGVMVTITVTAISGNAILLDVFRPLPSSSACWLWGAAAPLTAVCAHLLGGRHEADG